MRRYKLRLILHLIPIMIVTWILIGKYHYQLTKVVIHPRTDRPDLAVQQNFQMTKDPALGYPPIERNIIAFKEAKARILKNVNKLTSVGYLFCRNH